MTTFVWKKPKRYIDRVFVHCSASDRPEHDSWKVIDQWHKQRGWSGIGYHVFIRKDGVAEAGRDLELTPAAQAGHNMMTVAICLHGLLEDKFTREQFKTLTDICQRIDKDCAVTFHGHREVANKACPVFDYRKALGLDPKGHLGVFPETPPADPDEDVDLTKILRYGSQGQAVVALQYLLAGRGFSLVGDGEFGPKTENAVIEFQRVNNLVRDGIVGPLTWEALTDA